MNKDQIKLSLEFLLLGIAPVIFYAMILCFYTPNLMDYLREMIDLSLTWFLVYAIGFLIPIDFLKRFWFCLLLSLFSFMVFFKLSFYYLFESKLTPSAFYIILETNASETKDFLTLYFNWVIVILFLLIFIPLFKQLYLLFARQPSFKKLDLYKYHSKTNFLFTLFIIGGIFVSIYIVNKKTIALNIVYTSIDAYASYQEMQDIFRNDLGQSESDHFLNIESEDHEQTYVLVIGESTTSRNMSLYGYERETNPLLEEIKDELLVFKDVISPHAHTIPSLNKALTFSNYENLDKFNLGSIIQIMNAANFETYWLSNQKPIGLHENMITLLSKASDQQVFLSEDNHQYGAYDENLLGPLNEALSQSVNKKFIIIHLMGTHSVYKHRYPSEYDFFDDIPKTKFPSDKATQMINTYDNSIRYNDFVVREIIESVRKEKRNAYVLYLSDHGEEVFQDIDFVGHSEHRGSRTMFEIPFLLWLSEDLRKSNSKTDTFENYLNRKYLTDDLIHSVLDLSQVKLNMFKPERSIFNSNFKIRQRIIKETIDYDTR